METINLTQKHIKNTLLILVMLLSITSSKANVKSDNYSSLVIIKVTGLNTDSFNKIATGINKESPLFLEYSCLESDVIVIKFKHTFTEKGDVQHYINNKLKKWIGKTKVDFVYIDMVLGGSSKC